MTGREDGCFWLGARSRDKISGIEGTVVAVETWLFASTRLAIKRDGVDHNGAAWELHWVHAGEVEPVEP